MSHYDVYCGQSSWCSMSQDNSNIPVSLFYKCYLSRDRHVHLHVVIINVLASGVGHTTRWQLATKQFALIFDDVIGIYHQEIWHLYKVNS